MIKFFASFLIKTIPQKGEKWICTEAKEDPFPTKENSVVTILDVKDDWVRYYMSRNFPDNRTRIKIFKNMYIKA